MCHGQNKVYGLWSSMGIEISSMVYPTFIQCVNFQLWNSSYVTKVYGLYPILSHAVYVLSNFIPLKLMGKTLQDGQDKSP